MKGLFDFICLSYYIKYFSYFLFKSGSAKSNRVGFNTIPGSPQEPHEIQQRQTNETMYPLNTNPSTEPVDSRTNMPTIDEHENIAGSEEDEDEQAQMPTDDEVQTECKKEKNSNFKTIYDSWEM